MNIVIIASRDDHTMETLRSPPTSTPPDFLRTATTLPKDVLKVIKEICFRALNSQSFYYQVSTAIKRIQKRNPAMLDGEPDYVVKSLQRHVFRELAGQRSL